MLAATLISGCATASPVAPPIGARLQAGMAGGHAAFVAAFADPAQGEDWYASLREAQPEFTGDRRLTVTTRYAGDRRPSTQTVMIDLADDGRIAAAKPDQPQPVWTLSDLQSTSARHGTVLAVGLTAAQRQVWAERLDHAAAAVSKAAWVPTGDWSGGLVVVVPATQTDFAAVTGVAAPDTAAVTTCAGRTPRIVINPVADSQSASWLQATLTHEAVHAATDSPCLQGESWVVEGVAEAVAAGDDAATAASNAALVRGYLARHGRPTTLPSRPQTQTDYALASLAVQAVRRQEGAGTASVVSAGIARPLSSTATASATRCYLAALSRMR